MLFRIILLAVLVTAAVLFWKFWGRTADTEPFVTTLVALDTAMIDAISIHDPQEVQPDLLLRKVDQQWIGNLGAIAFPANQAQVDSLLIPVKSIRSADIAGPLEDWMVEPTEISYFHRGDVLGTLLVGKTIDSSVLRTEFSLKGHQDRYWVEEPLRLFVDRNFRDYRSFSFLKIDPAGVAEVGISMDPETVVTLQRDSLGWGTADWVPAWLRQLSDLKGEEYSDQFDPIANRDRLACAIRLSLIADLDPIGIYIYVDTTSQKPFTLNSSQFPNRFFRSDSAGLFQRVFPSQVQELLPAQTY